MTGSDIQTTNLRLVLQTTQQALAWVDALPPADRAEVSPDWLARIRASNEANPWTHPFSILLRASDTIIGGCCFKGAPSPDGMVEIAYGIDEDHRCNGYATEAANALVAYAFSSGQVQIVRAHTRPEANASTRVLGKCGFKFVGEVIDPEDGLVWRWERSNDVQTSIVCYAECAGDELSAASRRRGVTAGPLITLPSTSKREPWHGQSQLFSSAFHDTTHPRCVHIAEFRVTEPSV